MNVAHEQVIPPNSDSYNNTFGLTNSKSVNNCTTYVVAQLQLHFSLEKLFVFFSVEKKKILEKNAVGAVLQRKYL